MARPWIVPITVVGLALAAWVIHGPDPMGDDTAYGLEVVGPEEESIFNGTVHAQGTPFHVLREGARQGGFAVEYTGGGTGVFVTSVAGHQNEGPSGWCYEVHRLGEWTTPPVGAGAFSLRESDAVRWYWGQGGCRP